MKDLQFRSCLKKNFVIQKTYIYNKFAIGQMGNGVSDLWQKLFIQWEKRSCEIKGKYVLLHRKPAGIVLPLFFTQWKIVTKPSRICHYSINELIFF